MTASDHQESLVIKFTASWGAEEAIETGISLATMLGLEVTGVFQHEEAALGLASFPFAAAQLPGTSKAEPVTETLMLKTMHRQSSYCRGLLREKATQSNLTWSYRDSGEDGSGSETAQAGYQILPKEKILTDSSELLLKIRSAARFSRAIVVSAKRTADVRYGPIVAVVETASENKTLLSRAAKLASAGNRQLTILMKLDPSEREQDHEANFRSIIEASTTSAIELNVVAINGDLTTDLIREVHAARPAFVIAHLNFVLFANERTASTLLRSIESAILLLVNDNHNPST